MWGICKPAVKQGHCHTSSIPTCVQQPGFVMPQKPVQRGQMAAVCLARGCAVRADRQPPTCVAGGGQTQLHSSCRQVTRQCKSLCSCIDPAHKGDPPVDSSATSDPFSELPHCSTMSVLSLTVAAALAAALAATQPGSSNKHPLHRQPLQPTCCPSQLHTICSWGEQTRQLLPNIWGLSL